MKILNVIFKWKIRCFSRLSDLATLYDGGGLKENGLPEVDALTAEAYERRIQKVERENKELVRKLHG